jgi:hypothetical protein
MATKKQLMSNVQDSQYNAQLAGRVDLFPLVPGYVDQVELSTSSATYTIPTNAKFLIFSPASGAQFAVKEDAAAVWPAGSITDGSGSFLNPAQLDVGGITSLGIISNVSGILSIAVYW